MPVLLPTSLTQLTDELNYHTGKLIHAGGGGNDVRRSILPGGVRVITERMPSQRSVSIGFWVGVGSRDEAPGMLGSTHFLEHLLFKGTGQRTALDIAHAFDRVGGESNALTAKEHTCYYARVLDEDTSMAIDVIADMVTNAVIDPELLEQERGVILEEIAMDQDDPTDVAFESFIEQLMGAHPLGRPIGGTPQEITDVSREAVWDHYKKFYTPDRLVISAAGSLNHGEIVKLVMESLAQRGWDLSEGTAPAPRRERQRADITPGAESLTLEKNFEQTNIVMGCPGLIAGDDRRFAMSVLNSALGGGMSSRLFQEIREKRGLAYSTFSFSGSYSDAGYFGMYAGCLPAKAEQVTELMQKTFDDLARDGLTADELEKVIGQLGGSTILGSEDAGSRMSRLGRAELDSGRFMSLDELLEGVRAVTLDDVQDLARYLAQQTWVTTVVK
ncbi:pitrilysin family protein [Rothia sp. (in: high G+C Gram-positive bacteria)]|uniref:M16 family metallopeptidase n=1 Tax=Rothia sp. (in: high G+C Gram-positive bacteria) TaxID=1885016 RepID=UPI000EBC3381|nr:peptidase M16 [Rothia sp. (in: high G+C Gram-positive bacteria)]